MPQPPSDPYAELNNEVGEMWVPIETEPFDNSLPWQSQYYGRLSKAVNQGSPRARRTFRTMLLSIGGLVVLLVLVLVVVALRGG